MRKSLGVIMDPIAQINPVKDSTLAILLAAQRRDWELHYCTPADIYLRDNQVFARLSQLHVQDDTHNWFERSPQSEVPLGSLDVVLMRKDPPFDMEYIYSTYLLEKAALEGVLVANRPDSLRDVNEKFFTTYFPDCSPPTIISRSPEIILEFLARYKHIVVKPLDGMGGASIFQIKLGDPNTNVILETLLDHGRLTATAQLFLPEYTQGDKRILLIDGTPVDYALARLPAAGEGRANLAAGGSWKVVELTERDRWICDQVGPEMKKRGLIFVGLDVIGDYLTEINVTSPTGIRELDKTKPLDIGGKLVDCLAQKIQ